MKILPLLFFALPFLAIPLSARADQEVYQDPTAPVEARVADLLGRLTSDEKIRMLGGTGFTTQPIPRLGIPAFDMTDGPVGTRLNGPSTAYPAGVALAASWDRALAQRVGTALGRDCLSRGARILLGPGMNLYRAPMCGRNFEYLGEDPLLSGEMAAAYIRGVQSQGVAATVKHFAANNQEFNRHGLSSDMDEQTLRELYTRNFLIAVRDGQPRCVMTSYNLINGVHSSQNRLLITDILEHEFGFQGLVMSDWWSCYDTAGMLHAGLDLEMPRAQQYGPDRVQAALAAGKATQDEIDDCVRRQLRVAFAMGWFEKPARDMAISPDDAANAAVALDEAREGITLLKNEGGLLPLDPANVRRIVVLGPNGNVAVTGGGGSSYTRPFEAPSVAAGLAQVAGDPEKVIYLNWNPGLPPPAETLDIVRHADAAVVSVGFQSLSDHGVGPDDGSGRTNSPHAEGEGADRSYELPPRQADLIRQVAALNPRTIVVLNAGGSVETASWIDSAAALIHEYYGGQAGNTALAEILFGKTNPSGKLPFSWEKQWEDSAAYGNYPDAAHPMANDYKEGLLLGYRWFDTKKIEPLFPFGFGLSYTQFELTNFRAGRDMKDGTGMMFFTVDVRNTGARAGDEIVQVYEDETGQPGRPVRELKAFGRVSLQPGEKKTVAMSVNPADLATWDSGGHRWAPATGPLLFEAGDSSRNLVLRASL